MRSTTAQLKNKHRPGPLTKQPIAHPVEQLTFAMESNPSASGGVLKMCGRRRKSRRRSS